MKHVLHLAAMAAAFITATPIASAASYRMVVDLPVEAHWGRATLPAGKYTVTLGGSTYAPFFNVQGQHQDITLLAGVIQVMDRAPGTAKITLVESNGEFYVTRLDAIALGKSYGFPLKKSAIPETRTAAHHGTRHAETE